MSDDTNMSVELMDKILEIGTNLAPMRKHPSGGMVLTVPNGFRLEHLVNDDEKPLVTHRRPIFSETSSFIDYVNTFKKEGMTRIFFDIEKLMAIAVIDYDSPTEPQLACHRAELRLSRSAEWVKWNATAEGTKRLGLTQEDFAEFLEENGVDIVDPPAAQIMELVTKMQITRTVNYRRAINLSDGRQQFAYTNDGDNGAVEFPPHIFLAIPVFKGGDLYKVKVLLRYRLQDGGSLRFGMVINRAEEIMRTALIGDGENILGDIQMIKDATEVPLHIGTAS
jgi:uncharacterized protein YfdQ (DUF2303 family)